MTAAAENASAELQKLTREEEALQDRIANDQARLSIIAVQKTPLEKVVADAKTAEAKAPAKDK